MAKTKPNTLRLRSGVITGLIILSLAVIVILLQLQGSAAPRTGTQQSMTLDPQIVSNLTQMPEAAPLAGDAADQVTQLRALVDACPDYVPERRSQMEQHIAWLLNPALIPPEIIIALGTNPAGRLIFGMATYTSIQWRVDNNSPDSCLLPIGAMLNDMLTAAGEEPFPVFSR